MNIDPGDFPWQAMAEAMPVPLIISRLSDGLVMYANLHFHHLLGQPPETLMGRTATAYCENLDERRDLIVLLEHDGSVQNTVLNLRRQDGSRVSVKAAAQAALMDGEPAMIAVVIDTKEML
ncbi:MAG: PAS domain-containing protein [Rhizobacter sp.]|nr:PAS domain-containing protein [Chlorobiales bacterium]